MERLPTKIERKMKDRKQEEFDCLMLTTPYPTEKFSLKWSIRNYYLILAGAIDSVLRTDIFHPFEDTECFIEVGEMNINCARLTVKCMCSKFRLELEGGVTLYNSRQEILFCSSFEKTPTTLIHGHFTQLLNEMVKTEGPLPEDEFSIVLHMTGRRTGAITRLVEH